LELAYPVTFIGDGRGASIIDTGTANPAVRFKNPATSVQRNGCHIGGMTIHGTGSVGLTPKGLSTSVITEIELYGYTTALTLDGSYSGTIGSWHNTISDFNIHDVQDAIKLTGAGFPNGRANENHIGPGRIIDFTGSGVWIDSGDNNTIQMVDFAQLNISLGTSAGVSIHDILTKVWGCRFDPVHIGIDMISGAENAFRDNYFTGCDYGIKTSGGTGIVDGGYYSGNGTDVSDPGSHLTTR
jgi:hypothetical protein